MDRFNAFCSSLFSPSTTTPAPDALANSVREVIALSEGKTTGEQLAAFAYAWGSGQQEAPQSYRDAYERHKKTFLNAAGNVDPVLKTRKFHQNVRTGIRSQLPPDISTKLENTGRDCENKLEQGQGRYTYSNMKAEMQSAIRAFIRDPAGNTLQLREKTAPPAIMTATPPARLPSSAATASMPAFQPPPPALSSVTPAVPPMDNAPVVTEPASAPPVDSGMPFLDVFPAEWRSRPEWPNVIAGMKAYLSAFAPYRSQGQLTLLAANPKALLEGVASILPFSAMDVKETLRAAYERDIVNIKMKKPFDESTNEKVLGCKTSRMMESELAQQPGNQVSIAMRVPLLTQNGLTRRPMIISVSGPALDIKDQPEWKHYVKDGCLDQTADRTAFETLASHIEACIALPENEGAELVLSGFGLTNFLAGLPEQEKDVSRTIGANVLIDLIRKQRADGVDVAYTDVSGTSPPWPAVNAALIALGDKPLTCVGSIPGDWIKDHQIIVNAWDPHALIGNGCARDNSLDGYIGRNSLVHETHALACILYANKFGI